MSNSTISLNGLSVSDLTALQSQIDEQIKIRKEQEKQDVKNKVLALLADAGFSFSDIFPDGKSAKSASAPAKSKVKVKYSDGQNNWTGRGKMPLWVKKHLESGGQMDSLKVS